jgi:hypothetical protein
VNWLTIGAHSSEMAQAQVRAPCYDSRCDAFRDTLIEQRKDLNTMSDDAHEVQKMLRDALAGMPVTIESGLSDPKASVTSKLKWVEIALRVFRGPVGRPATDLELENKRKVARTLREAVPALEKICDEHRSERLRNTAARYLQYIESEVGRSDRG